jgi:non-ribosomal peptide synthetase component E (peptide arylation enzyme)
LTDQDVRQSGPRSEDHGVARYKLPKLLVLIDHLPATKVGKKALRADIAGRLATSQGE